MDSHGTKRHSFQPLLFAPPQGPDALPKTVPEPPPPPARPRQQSHVRLRSAPAVGPEGTIDWVDAQDLLDELLEDQLMLSMSLACLERASEDGPRDPSARAALQSLVAKVTDLLSLRDALADIQELAVDVRFHRLFVTDAPLAEYLRGIYAWAHAVVRALDTLATSLRTLTPDWALFRWRIEEAKNFHFDELADAIRAELAAVALVAPSFQGPALKVAELAAAVGRLFASAEILEASLDQRFG